MVQRELRREQAEELLAELSDIEGDGPGRVSAAIRPPAAPTRALICSRAPKHTAVGLLIAAVVFALALTTHGQTRPAAHASWPQEESLVKLHDSDWPAPPSLFCFSIIRGGSHEEALIRAQFQHRASIFACEESAVLCNRKVSLGQGAQGEVWTWESPVAEVGWHDGAFPNAIVFIKSWDTLIHSGRVWEHDWIVKVDTDAVFFPDRLRLHVMPYQGKSLYFTNCGSEEAPKSAKLFGSLEVFSKKAVRAYAAGKKKCEAMDYAGMREDRYMQTCLDMLNVSSKFDSSLAGDAQCSPASCDDWTRVSFHPYRDVGSYFSCFGQAIH